MWGMREQQFWTLLLSLSLLLLYIYIVRVFQWSEDMLLVWMKTFLFLDLISYNGYIKRCWMNFSLSDCFLFFVLV